MSKQWKKFDSWCLKLAGLPNVENPKHINHICSSNKVLTTHVCEKNNLVLLFLCFVGGLYSNGCTNCGRAERFGKGRYGDL